MTVIMTETIAQEIVSAPDGMVLISAGPFLMGNNYDFYDNDFEEQPRHVVDLPPFYMDIYPVTIRDYKTFVDAARHPLARSASGTINRAHMCVAFAANTMALFFMFITIRLSGKHRNPSDYRAQAIGPAEHPIRDPRFQRCLLAEM
jgi:formylglycine-generating enzyme required for sulfatase activity